MTTLVFIILMLLVVRCSAVDNEWWVYEHNTIEDERQVERLARLMRGYMERAEIRWTEILPIKTEIEETSQDQKRAFEKGYIMADIVETYRKALVFTHKQIKKGRYLETERIRYMMYVQNAYIKSYHLTHMMHEINPKFETDNTGQISKFNLNDEFHDNTPSHYNTSGFYYTKELEDIRQARVRERRKKVVDEKRIRQAEIERGSISTRRFSKTTTDWWPVAYGWDIDYYW
ncbi:uncharacterized protein LOC134802444 [Cydia splendana]|uniref:uncharacterized protein LOC134802444 n=1 Tax=Cydia splendana TaxID=1100963 RepID=UPI0028F4737B